ncbi:hypothetical protein J6590_091093 [Homalodisca vitripennis]|nr:hypothetical protein J6590_091093 [Homalodisca vitripennis]
MDKDHDVFWASNSTEQDVQLAVDKRVSVKADSDKIDCLNLTLVTGHRAWQISGLASPCNSVSSFKSSSTFSKSENHHQEQDAVPRSRTRTYKDEPGLPVEPPACQAAVTRSDQPAFESPPDSQGTAGYSAQPTLAPAIV